jgi:TQXA domain-containing protein
MKLARAGSAVVGASVALMLAAGIPAGAEPVAGNVTGDAALGYQVNLGEDHRNLTAKLFEFTLEDGTKLQMYCVEINTDVTDEKMVEQPWAEYPSESSPFNQNSEKINWVLHNGYPVKSADTMTEVLTAKGVTLNDGINVEEAITATQAAVWHFSDGVDIDIDDALTGGNTAAEADVVAMYQYLIGADNVGIGAQPTPALQVDPAELEGEAGTRIGPFTVSTNGEVEGLASDLPEGVKITDVDGVELDASTIKDGTQVYLDVPADAAEGEGSFELTATARVDAGRLFVGENYEENPTQSLIVAKAESSEIVARGAASWTAGTTTTTPPTETTTTPPATETTSSTPVPQPKANEDDLAETGASIFAPIMIGVVLVGAGIGALFFQRHRKRA